MSFFRRLMGAMGANMTPRHGIEVGDRFVKTDGQYQSVWTVRQIVHFDGIPPHVRLVPDHEHDLGYRTISVLVLHDADFYRAVAPSSSGHGRQQRARA